MSKTIYVIKNNGTKEPFSSNKVYQSALRAGASNKEARQITEKIQRQAYPDIRTSEIFKKIEKALSSKPSLKFSLKKAMKKLGPTGFLFEKYIGDIFSKQGYKVKLNQHLSGHCLDYEIDFLAEKDNSTYIGECKYKNLPEGLIHSQMALANHARFLDIIKKNPGNTKSIMVTNTRFTKNVVDFCNCVGTELLGWKYPPKRGLEYFIESYNLYPITILPSFKKDLGEIFIAKQMMLAEDVFKINSLEIRRSKILLKQLEKLKKEADLLLS